MILKKILAVMAFCWTAATLTATENLNRALIAFNTGDNTTFVSWRFFDGEQSYTYRLYRNGVKMVETKRTAHTFPIESKLTDSYKLEVLDANNRVVDQAEAKPYDQYMKIALTKPDASVNNNSDSYTPNDIAVGDVDGDGQMELFVKWDPANSQDNSKSGKTSNVIIDCYQLDGTRLWSVNLGPNIRAGAHYTQMLVYDFDSDGQAEMIVKTAPWSKDAQGRYVSEAADDETIRGCKNSQSYRNGSGYVLSGPEFLTVFSGKTGAAIHTIWYNPNRAGQFNQEGEYPSQNFWGDNYGNRCDRYNACVAYLDGQNANPSAILNRGYYTRAYLWAVDFDGAKLKHRWLHASVSDTKVEHYDANWQKTEKHYEGKATSGDGSNTMYGNGNHNISVADVDGDGCDEILFGSAACDNDGTLLYATGFGHGDAIHVGKMRPDAQGLQVFQIHEEKGTYSWDLHDAATGEVLFKGGNAGIDNGRGIAGDFNAAHRGYEFSSSDERQQRSAITGNVVSTKSCSLNFRLYWDGTLQDCLADGGFNEAYTITHWNGSSFAAITALDGQSCNTTKRNPNLVCDLLGDWREEVILHDGNHTLYIHSSAMPTNYKVPCLLTDHTYRLGIAWQMSSYNQPPHLGYYLPDATTTIDVSQAEETLFYDPATLAGEGVQHTEVGEGSINWVLESGTGVTEETAAVETALANYFAGSTVSIGGKLTATGTKVNGAGQTHTLFQPTEQASAAADDNAVDFMLTLKDDYEFLPTRVEVKASRWGTNGGGIDMTWVNGDGSLLKLLTGQLPERAVDSSDGTSYAPYFTLLSKDITNGKATKGTFGVRFNIYGIATNKQISLSDLHIEGKVYSTVATGIKQLEHAAHHDAVYYDLQGRRVEKPTKGLYILNGKKIIKR